MPAQRYTISYQSNVTVPGAPTGTPTPPASIPDPVITVGAWDFSVAPYTLEIGLPAYDVTIPNALVEVHVIQIPAGTNIPTDAASALALSVPRGGVDVTGRQGVSVKVPVPGMTPTVAGTQDTFVVVSGFANAA
jgi:hypothetical protein